MNNILNLNILVKFGGLVLIAILSVLLFSIFTQDVKGDGPVEVNSIEDLNNIRNDLSGDYILMRDLDFQDDGSYDDPSNKGDYTTGSGWVPIGTYSDSFVGTFDGQGFEIKNLFIDKSSELTGFWGKVSDSGSVENLGLKDVNVTGLNVTGGFVGELVSASISNSYVTGNVSGSTVVGGFVGFNLGEIVDSHAIITVSASSSKVGGFVGENWEVISKSYATGSIDEGGNSTGGFVGYNNNWDAGSPFTGTISDSYATVNIDVSGNAVGGFVGDNLGNISNSYTTGNVSGGSNVGGFVGYNVHISTRWGDISNSYSTGNVLGVSGNVGGFIGTSQGDSVVSNSYFLNHANNPSDCLGGGSGTAACAEITDPDPGESYFFTIANSPMDEWDFVDIWSDGNNGSDYPTLAWQFTPADPEPERSSSPKPSHSVTLPSTGEGSQSESYRQGTAISINAPIKVGHTFLHWEDGEGNILSTNRIYSFIVGGDMEVHPVYEEIEETEADEEENPPAGEEDLMEDEDILDGEEELSEPQRQIRSLMRSLISLLQQRLETLLSQVGN